MFYQIFFSPQVKRCPNISCKHGIYELPHELPNNLRLSILGNQETPGKCLNPIDWYPSPQSTCQIETFVNFSKKLLKNKNWTVLVVRYFTWKLELVSDILWMIVVSFLFFDPQKDSYFAFFLFLVQQKFDIFLKRFFSFRLFLLQKDFHIFRVLLFGVFLCVFHDSYLTLFTYRKKYYKMYFFINFKNNFTLLYLKLHELCVQIIWVTVKFRN